jgi:hypothetical protein
MISNPESAQVVGFSAWTLVGASLAAPSYRPHIVTIVERRNDHQQ